MLKDLLKSANAYNAELKEKKENLEKTEHELISVRSSLDEINMRASERLNEGFSRKMHLLHEKVQRLSETQHMLTRWIEGGELAFDSAVAGALDYVKSHGHTLSEISEIEDEIVYELLIARDETRIIEELFKVKELYVQAMSRLDHCRVKVVDAERDGEVIRLRTAYNYACKNLNEFRARMSAALPMQQQMLMRDESVLLRRVSETKEAMERLLSEYGVLHLFSELEMAEAECREMSGQYEKAKLNADTLPLTSPVGRFEKGKGVITTELLARRQLAGPEQYKQPQTEQYKDTQGYNRYAGYMPRAERRDYDEYEYDDGYPRRMPQRRRTSGNRERLIGDLRAIQEEIAVLKREAERARSDANEIKRAKMLAALNVKRSLVAANRSSAAAKAAERELIKNKLAGLSKKYGEGGKDNR